MSTVQATRRIQRGRGHSYLLDGDRADGVTTVVGDGIPKRALVDWAARVTAGYAVDHWDDLEAMKPSDRLRTLEKARWADVKSAGIRGTDIHALALQLAGGQEVDVPEHLTGHVDSYLAFVDDWQPVELLTETVVANRRYRYMGTLDVVARLADTKTWLLDFKTGASGIWPEAAVQLSAYRNAQFYLDAAGAEQPMPQVDEAGCIWLRADGYDLIPVNTDPDTFRVFLYAQQLAAFTKEPRETYIGEIATPPAKEAA